MVKAARQSSVYLGPSMDGAQEGFCGAAVLDLLCLVTNLPLVVVMWRGYIDTCVGL
jgi:hypothetical protein